MGLRLLPPGLAAAPDARVRRPGASDARRRGRARAGGRHRRALPWPRRRRWPKRRRPASPAPGWPTSRPSTGHGLASRRGRLPRLRPVRVAPQHRVRRRPRARADWMVVGEAPGRAGGPAGRALRRPGRPAAGQHAARARADARRRRRRRVHRQRAQVPAARQPQPASRRRSRSASPSCAARWRWCSRGSSWRWAASRCRRCCSSSEPIGRLRGRVHRYQGVPLVVTYHPAYLLRNLPDKAKAWADLCLAADLMDGGGS